MEKQEFFFQTMERYGEAVALVMDRGECITY